MYESVVTILELSGTKFSAFKNDRKLDFGRFFENCSIRRSSWAHEIRFVESYDHARTYDVIIVPIQLYVPYYEYVCTY